MLPRPFNRSFLLLSVVLALAANRVNGQTRDNGTLSAYNESHARYMMDFAGASYCAGTLGHGVEHWSE